MTSSIKTDPTAAAIRSPAVDALRQDDVIASPVTQAIGPASSRTLRRVVEAGNCSGCGFCASVSRGAISMRSVEPGYNRPQQHAPIDAATERVIAACCPGSVVEPWAAAPHVDPYWGPYHRLATGFATDPKVRFESSSGGVVTALALQALATGLVDRVVHVHPDPLAPADNIIVVSSDPAEVAAGAGSRYVASSPLRDIDRTLSDGGSLAFVGKPCDVSALRRLARIDRRVDDHVALMLAFFCAGVPSRRAVTRVLRALDVEPSEVESFRFRGHGWPGRATARTRDGRVADMSYEDSWGGHLSKEVQSRCKICPDAVGGVADVACADAWYGGETGYPKFEELEGRSLIMSRTERGETFLSAAVASGAIEMEPLPIEDVILMQPGQARRKRLVRARTAALTATLRPKPSMDGLLVEEAARLGDIKDQARNFLGSIRRSLMGREHR